MSKQEITFECPYKVCRWPKCQWSNLHMNYPLCASAIETAKREHLERYNIVPIGREGR